MSFFEICAILLSLAAFFGFIAPVDKYLNYPA